MCNMTWINGIPDGAFQSVLTVDLRLLSAQVMGTMLPCIEHRYHRLPSLFHFRKAIDTDGGFIPGATGAVESRAFFPRHLPVPGVAIGQRDVDEPGGYQGISITLWRSHAEIQALELQIAAHFCSWFPVAIREPVGRRKPAAGPENPKQLAGQRLLVGDVNDSVL